MGCCVSSRGDGHGNEVNNPVSFFVADADGVADASEANGFTLAGLYALRAEALRYNRRHRWSRIKTTMHLANKIIKPRTKDLPTEKQAYVHLSEGMHRAVPVFFASHTWGGDAIGLLEALIVHGEGVVADGESPPAYYLDVVSVDQHMTDQAAGNTAMPFETLSKDFVAQIRACAGGVVVVAAPFHNPLVVRRAWCLFEVAEAKANDVPVTVVTPPAEAVALRKKVQAKTGHEIVINVMTAIDSSKADATMAEDLANIRRVIESEIPGGYAAVDEIFKTVLRQWVIGLLGGLLETFPDGSHDAMVFASRCGMIMSGVADHSASLAFYERELSMAQKRHGEEHVQTARSYNNVGSAYKWLGELDKAVEMFERSLAIRRKELREEHADVATSYNNLGLTHMDKGDISKGAELLESALRIRLKVLRNNDPEIGTGYNNLGMIYKEQGEYSKAIKMCEQALAISRKQLGENHPNVAGGYNNLGSLYLTIKDYRAAVDHFEKALAICNKVLGPEHPNTESVETFLRTANSHL